MEDISALSENEEGQETLAGNVEEHGATNEEVTKEKASNEDTNKKEITQPFGTIVSHVTDSDKTPPTISSAKLENLKLKSYADFLKVMMKA